MENNRRERSKMSATERMSPAEYRKETGSGSEIKETPLSAQIAGLMNSLNLENDRLQSGKLYVVTKYTSRKTGKQKEHGRWVQMAKKGTPDRWCLIHSRWILVEVKTKGKKPTDVQIDRQQDLAAAGAIILNVDSLEDAQRHLAALKTQLDPKRREQQLKLRLEDFYQELDCMDSDEFVNRIMKLINERKII